MAFALMGAMALSIVIPVTSRVSASAAATLKPNVYVSEYDTRKELSAAATDLDKEITAEGAVLLKNEDNALPLAEGSKVSIFGKASARYSYAGEFGAAGFKVNNILSNFYSDSNLSGKGADSQSYGNAISAGLNTGETPIENYTQNIKDSFKDYNDAAIVVFYRAGREGWDNPRTMMWDGESYGKWTDKSDQLVPGARAKDDHYLQLDQNETDLLKMCAENFEKVIVLLHTPSSMETGFLDDPGHYAYQKNIKAAFFISDPYNTSPVAQILKGEISPSGRTTDTWARDFKLDPTWQNFGNYLMEVNPSQKGNQYANLPSSEGLGGGGYVNNYVTYNEGIYVGYRYWETRGLTEGNSSYTSATEAEKAQYLDASSYEALPNGSGGSAGKSKDYIHGTTTTNWDSWYDAHVVYPLGYGLSYTTFEQTLVSAEPVGNSTLTKDGTITLKVKVKNTGSVAGKDVVQVYYTAPYKNGQVEKAHVVLAAFAKTKLLEPAEEETLTLSFSVQSMASYDYSDANQNGFKGYELDAGDYVVKLMKNAHETIETVTYVLDNGIQYETDEATGNKVENRFDDVSDYITDDLGQKYLSRSDWEGTWPKFNYKLTASEDVINGLKEWLVTDGQQTRDPEADKSEPYYTEEMPTTNARNGIKLEDLRGLDFDDPKWDQYLDQFSVNQLIELVTKGSYVSGKDFPEYGVKAMTNCDDVNHFVPQGGAQDTHYHFGTPALLASTWNTDLAYRYGKMIGEDALWGWNDQIGAWYAPAVNLHRSQFGGRNAQYYSEDGFLAGMISANTVKGTQEKGLLVYCKHFALNNSENNRCGLITWANEQSMRELYFKSFEVCVKEGGALGIMSSLNRIGTTWAGGSYELLTEVLRNEWGFKGTVVTDSYLGDTSNLSNADQMIRAGGTLALGWANLNYNKDSATTITCLRNAVHNLLYAQAHSNALNSMPQGEHTPIQTFTGGLLERAVTGMPYTANVANAKLSDVFYPDIDDSEIKYTIAEGSRLPEGLTLSEQGEISGIPTEEINSFRFKVKATYDDYSRTAEFTISVVGYNGAIVYEAEENLGTIYVNKAANLTVAGAKVVNPNATGALPTCTYALASGSKLPAGLTLNADGTITGTPTSVCENYAFSVTASASGYPSVTLPFKLNVFYEMTFTGGALAGGKLGVSYMQKLPAAETQGKVTYALSEESKLPNGLTLTSGGYITGTPREAVTDYTFTVIATSPFTEPVEAQFTLTIGLSFNETTLQNGRTGESYSARVDTAQGAGEISYTLKAGSALPEGLTLSENGVISGTPSKAGDYTFTVVASAEGKVGDEITLTLHIDEGQAGGNSGGCGGVIGLGGAGVFLATVCVLGGVLLMRGKRKKEDTSRVDNEEK